MKSLINQQHKCTKRSGGGGGGEERKKKRGGGGGGGGGRDEQREGRERERGESEKIEVGREL